jgi:hypothetical protein
VARLFQSSFEKLTPLQMQQTGLWAFVGAGIVATTGRTGGGVTGTAGATVSQNSMRSRTLTPASPAAGYQGFAVKCTSFPAAERKVWALLDSSGGALITLTILPDGKARVYRGSFESGTLLATSPAAMFAAAAFRYIQVGYDFTADTLNVLSTVTGTTTSFFAAPGLTSPLPWAQSAFYLDETIVLDDWYANDTLAANGDNYFSGDTSIVVLDPSSVSYKIAYFPWTPNTGTDVSAVNDATMDVDATYIYTRQSYSWIQYAMEALADDGRRVDDVQMVAIARVVSSAFQPGMDFDFVRWDGIELPVSKTPGGINTPVTQTAYTAFVAALKAKNGLGPNSWTIARVNSSRYGVRS